MNSRVVAIALSGLLEDEEREGDDPEPVAELVDRVGEDQAAECRPFQGLFQAWAGHLNLHFFAQVWVHLHKFPPNMCYKPARK